MTFTEEKEGRRVSGALGNLSWFSLRKTCNLNTVFITIMIAELIVGQSKTDGINPTPTTKKLKSILSKSKKLLKILHK